MKCLSTLFAFIILTSAVDAQTSAPAAASKDQPDYIRYFEEAGSTSRLQTAVVRFRKGSTIVDLVGVVHLADATYFDELNELLREYDAVLYEMVGGRFQPESDSAPDPTADPGAAPEMAGVRHMQQLARSFLGLEFQLDGIDYAAPNFVHADVEWDQFNALMLAKNQSFATLFTRAFALAGEGAITGLPADEEMMTAMMKRVFTAVLTGNSTELKRNLAPLLSEAESFITQLEGDDGTVLVSERNRVVMATLARESEGRGRGKFAIFYGAGHMPDLEKRLLAEGFTKEKAVWTNAWTIAEAGSAGPASGAGAPAALLGKLLEDNPEIISTIQQLGSFLETLRAGAE